MTGSLTGSLEPTRAGDVGWLCGRAGPAREAQFQRWALGAWLSGGYEDGALPLRKSRSMTVVFSRVEGCLQRTGIPAFVPRRGADAQVFQRIVFVKSQHLVAAVLRGIRLFLHRR